ncbi:MAG TPA: prepilin-type N-terminal cleavage/methylation domain-containing protein [Pyrinomonadaceae bacterium]|nr:prepilin-type N-terminal cleavage/methylation domain-containing protein [Pyrinomonadaceae bacterium]
MSKCILPKRRQKESGFTLLETSVAMVVMMIGGLGIAAVFTYAIKSNTGARDRAASIAVAQQELERLRNLPFDHSALTATGGVNTTSVTSAGRSYRMSTRILDTTSTVKSIQIQVTPENSSNPWSLSTVNVMAERAHFTLGPYQGGP